jgi:hypothetical protein
LVPEIDRSFKIWRDIETVPIEFVAMGCSDSKYNENDGINSVLLLSTTWPFDSVAIAITRNFYVAGTTESSGLILDSDILLNGVHHQFSVGAEAGKHDIRNIVTHEVGHFLGLGHEVAPVSTDSTMYAIAATGEVKKQTLERNDIDGIESAYTGYGQKLKEQHSVCQIAEGNMGCHLGVSHRRGSSPLSYFIGLLFVLAQIALARFLRLTRSTSISLAPPLPSEQAGF